MARKMTSSEYLDIQKKCERIKDEVYNAGWSSDAKQEAKEKTNRMIDNLEDKYGYSDPYVERVKKDMEWYRSC